MSRVGTNSGMDYWNRILDWTTGLSYFPFLVKFLHLFLEEAYVFIWLLWVIVVMSQYSYLLQCFHKYILENTAYCKLSEVKGFMVYGKMIGNHAKPAK